MPQPMVMRFVSRAAMAVTAVEERLHGVLSPPGIGFGEPEGVEAGSVAGLRHANGFLQRLHAELQHTYLERHTHRFDFLRS